MEQHLNPDFVKDDAHDLNAEKIDQATERISGQATALKEKISEQARTYGDKVSQRLDQARVKTSAGLKNTSQRIQNLANYMDEHNTRDMSQSLMHSAKSTIRKYPGRSIAIGLIVGMMLGRACNQGK